MSKIIETGSDSRTKLLKGATQLAEAVVTTLGPNGRNVVIAQQGGNLPTSTKDGVTVAKTIELKDPIANLGAQMVKQAAIRTGDIAGDGTTTSTLLAKELIEEGMNHLSQKHNAVSIKKGIEKAAKQIVSKLKTISTDIESEDQIVLMDINKNKAMGYYGSLEAAIKRISKLSLVSEQKDYTLTGFIESYNNITNKLTKNLKNI